MNPREQKRRFKQLSDRLLNGDEFSVGEREWFAGAFKKIADGEDVNEVLGLKNGVGHSDYDALKKQQLSLALHWIAGANQPKDGDLPGLGLNISAACRAASKIFENNIKYKGRKIPLDPEYLRQRWYKKDYKHMQNPFRRNDDPDHPYNY
jgi:hypothetical protein